jgi:hypothetical protein
MVLVNQKVADEIATMVARHRYSVEDGRDTVKAAEAASARRNEEIKAEAAERTKQVTELAHQGVQEAAAQQDGRARNDWAAERRDDSNVISFADDEYEEAPPAPPQAAASPAPPSAPPKPAPRRATAYDDYDDYENQSWLR